MRAKETLRRAMADAISCRGETLILPYNHLPNLLNST